MNKTYKEAFARVNEKLKKFREAEEEKAPPADEGGDEEGAPEQGDEEGGEEGADTEGMPSKALSVNFDKSAVLRYNKASIEGNSAEAKQITPDGIVATVQPDGVDVLINFDDITESANGFFKKNQSKANMKESVTKKGRTSKLKQASLTEQIDSIIRKKLKEAKK